jgi:hypothetical protein
MTPDDITLMADASGLSFYGMGKDRDKFLHYLERFAALVAAQEREACAKVAKETVCDMHLGTGIKIYGTRAAAAIRARGQE